MNKWLRIFLIGIVALAVLALLIQIIPYGHDHTNPAVVEEPNWDSPQTRELAQRACFDCHSNETVWPWYSNIAPVSWLIYHDVSDGRQHLNLSEGGGQSSANEIRRVLQSGEMPPANYLLLHPEARLTDQERQALIDGLVKSTQE
jgi:hypothetical protein